MRGDSATGKKGGAPKGAAPGVRRRGACALLALVRLRRAARDRVGLGPGHQAAGLQPVGVMRHAALVVAVVAGPAFAQVAGGLDVRPDDDARSEERREGEAGVSKWRSRWAPTH